MPAPGLAIRETALGCWTAFKTFTTYCHALVVRAYHIPHRALSLPLEFTKTSQCDEEIKHLSSGTMCPSRWVAHARSVHLRHRGGNRKQRAAIAGGRKQGAATSSTSSRLGSQAVLFEPPFVTPLHPLSEGPQEERVTGLPPPLHSCTALQQVSRSAQGSCQLLGVERASPKPAACPSCHLAPSCSFCLPMSG